MMMMMMQVRRRMSFSFHRMSYQNQTVAALSEYNRIVPTLRVSLRRDFGRAPFTLRTESYLSE